MLLKGASTHAEGCLANSKALSLSCGSLVVGSGHISDSGVLSKLPSVLARAVATGLEQRPACLQNERALKASEQGSGKSRWSPKGRPSTDSDANRLAPPATQRVSQRTLQGLGIGSCEDKQGRDILRGLSGVCVRATHWGQSSFDTRTHRRFVQLDQSKHTQGFLFYT
jgi:hypothetical protein